MENEVVIYETSSRLDLNEWRVYDIAKGHHEFGIQDRREEFALHILQSHCIELAKKSGLPCTIVYADVLSKGHLFRTETGTCVGDQSTAQ